MARKKELTTSSKYVKSRTSAQFRNSITYINEQIKDTKQLLARKEYAEGGGKNIERVDLENGVRKLQDLKNEIKGSAKEAEVQAARDSIEALFKTFKPEIIKKIAASYKNNNLQNSKAGIEALKKSLDSLD
jgi:hypothetical protein